jgi:hypothetical protein
MAAMRTTEQATAEVKARTKPRDVNPASFGEDTPPMPPKKVSAKKVLARLESGMTPEEKAIKDYFDRDLCRLQPEFSMKAIGDPNRAYQARYDELDRAHSARFAAMLEQGQELFPVVIFQTSIGDRYRVILADGFHRHHAHWCLKRESIPAYVITLPEEDIERAARLYAAMCNQILSKPRSDKDKEKAIQIVCAVPECQTWTDKAIADHCGVDPRMVARVRKEYRIRKRKDIPPARARRIPANKPAPTTLLPDEEPRPTLVGKPVKVAEDAPVASEAFQPPPTDFVPLHSVALFKNWLLDRGVIAEKPAVPGAGVQVSGLLAGGRAIVLCGSTSVDDIQLSIGRALIYAVAAGEGLKATVVLVEQSAHRRIYAAGRECGCEFLSPEDLVADLLGEETEEDDGA